MDVLLRLRADLVCGHQPTGTRSVRCDMLSALLRPVAFLTSAFSEDLYRQINCVAHPMSVQT